MSASHPMPGITVIALGGNAIARFGDDGSVTMQYRRAAEALAPVADLIAAGSRVVVTHGNGPVIGSIVLRGELARGQVPPTPLYIAGADSEGGIGLMLQQVLGNELRARSLPHTVATVVTQVIVDPADPAFSSPTKPIGPYCDALSAETFANEYGWDFAEEPGRGWRRVVASPRPLRVVEARAVSALVDAGCVAIAAGGGGVPVSEAPDGSLAGIDAVVDKDWSAALLARDLGADVLAIVMEEDGVYEAFGTPAARRIERLGVREAAALAATMAPGSIGPKIAAAASFARAGTTAIICDSRGLTRALAGTGGTLIEPE